MASQPRPFPRYLELPNAKNYAPEWGLRQSKATLRDITDPQYWRKLCPELTVSDDKKSEERINYDKDLVRDVREQVRLAGALSRAPQFRRAFPPSALSGLPLPRGGPGHRHAVGHNLQRPREREGVITAACRANHAPT